ncbi:protein phosphatase 1 regulatory subunit 1C isoform X4 [Acipenser ruthenus]|uniref:protein phosphatase 1 regulatory subunit 1C isoform X4 n=1 Tax=Acipenser ruthenus TaxID=7906 RepID=UPI002740C21A|nr:protein phosphatase 1 regulatory subunit 1C isoform X4 [Acipenser ruthenus]
MEPNSPKKIQFAVPLFQSQLDPQAAEQIRKRRPTPATLVIFNDQSPPEADEQRTTNSQGQAKSAEMSPKQRKQSVYTPPTMKELQLVVEQHLQRQEQLEPDYSECDPSCLDQLSPMTNECCHGNGALLTATEWGTCNFPEPNGSEPCVKLLLSTADHPDSSCTGGVKLMKSQKETAFPEEEEGVSDRQEDWTP